MVSKWVITPIYPVYKQVIAHLLTIDPNFQRDIQADGVEDEKNLDEILQVFGARQR